MLLGRRLHQSRYAKAVHAGKMTRTGAPHRPGTVYHRICATHQTTQAFQVTKVAFYPAETNTCEMVSPRSGADQRSYLPVCGSQPMRHGAAYKPCCSRERYYA